MLDLPFATPDFPGVGGVLRERPEDFFVQELPAYEPSGEGEHIIAEVQKVGLTTHEAVRRMAAALGVAASDIGYAGLKDRHAVTRQLFSFPAAPGVDEERVMRLQVDGLAPQWAARHGNKLRVGHLAGNRFAVKIRQVDPTAVVRLRPLLERLEHHGLPNYYGEQRFGVDEKRPTHLIGAALAEALAGDGQRFCDLLLGGDDDRDDVAEARRLYDAGRLEEALAAWPGNIQPERRVLERLLRTGDPAKAARAVDSRMRKFYLSAAQSAVFNRVVAQRLAEGALAGLRDGDVAVKHVGEGGLRTGGMFLVEDAAAEQERCAKWEISPTGPLHGRKMRQPAGAVQHAEEQACRDLGLEPERLAMMPGDRRPLRVRPHDTRLASGIDEHGGHITIAFTLPAGSFATVLLREVMKG